MNSAEHQLHGDLPSRVGKVEGRLDQLQTSITHVETRVDAGFGDLNHKLDKLTSKFSDSSQTPWNSIWSAVGVALAIVIAVGSLAYQPLREADTRNTESNARQDNEIVQLRIDAAVNTERWRLQEAHDGAKR